MEERKVFISSELVKDGKDLSTAREVFKNYESYDWYVDDMYNLVISKDEDCYSYYEFSDQVTLEFAIEEKGEK